MTAAPAAPGTVSLNFDPLTVEWAAPDYRPIYAQRAKRLEGIRASTNVLAASLRFYETHPLEFIQDWFITYEPRRLAGSIIPFVLWPRQREFIAWLHARVLAREDAIVEKSRDMGVTWLCVAYATWMWRFHQGSKFTFGSRKAQLVDRLGDPDSILEKVRMILRYLPPELLPGGFNVDEHANLFKIRNPENGSLIAGEGGKEMGRGGRSTIFCIDEAAFLEQPERVDAAISHNSDVKIYVSTAGPAGGPFYRKRHSRQFPVFSFHWHSDPRKGEAWYKRQQALLDPVTFAREVEIDWDSALERIVIPSKWVRASRELACTLTLPEYGGGIGGLDVGGGGSGRSVFIARFGPIVTAPVAWQGGDTTATAHRALEESVRHGIVNLTFDSIGVGAGVASTLQRLPDPIANSTAPAVAPRLDLFGRPIAPHLKVRGVQSGDQASASLWPDGRRSREKFANLRAEIWWMMRDRLNRTYEHWLHTTGQSGGVEHQLDDLLLLPDHPGLEAELSTPTWNQTATGRILIESKDTMKRRGVSSPDHADALSLCFIPEDPVLHVKKVVGFY